VVAVLAIFAVAPHFIGEVPPFMIVAICPPPSPAVMGDVRRRVEVVPSERELGRRVHGE
jgi:hypothetical protein